MTSKARDISISGVGIGIHSGGAGMASTVTTLNFIGDGNAMAFHQSTNTMDITSHGLGISSGGNSIGAGVTQINFIGAATTVSAAGGNVNVTIGQATDGLVSETLAIAYSIKFYRN